MPSVMNSAVRMLLAGFAGFFHMLHFLSVLRIVGVRELEGITSPVSWTSVHIFWKVPFRRSSTCHSSPLQWLSKSVAMWLAFALLTELRWEMVSAFPTSNAPSSKPVKEGCVSCAREKQISRLDDRQLSLIRLEMMKQQILIKLGMSGLPLPVRTVTSSVTLPSALMQSRPSNHVESLNDAEPESYYGGPQQLFLLPEIVSVIGEEFILDFRLTEETEFFELESAVLWVPILPAHNDLNTTEPGILEGDWLQHNITSVVINGLRKNSTTIVTRVKCSKCQTVWEEWTRHEIQPVLVIKLDPTRDKRHLNQRKKRSPTCGPGVTECCRDSLYINFQAIGWDWVLHPPGFEAYFCRGSCQLPAAVSQSASQHATVVQKLMSRNGLNNTLRSQLVPCCTPTRMSSLTLMFVDKDNAIKEKTLNHIVVESCGCAV